MGDVVDAGETRLAPNNEDDNNAAAGTAALSTTDDRRRQLASGITALVHPVVNELDTAIKAARTSQITLRHQIDALAEDLRRISDRYSAPYDLDAYIKKLLESRKRIAVVNSILQNAQERLHKLLRNIQKETRRREASLEGPPPEMPPC